MTAKPKETEIASGRREILDAAEELFAQKGFNGATTRDLAAKAGVQIFGMAKHKAYHWGP